MRKASPLARAVISLAVPFTLIGLGVAANSRTAGPLLVSAGIVALAVMLFDAVMDTRPDSKIASHTPLPSSQDMIADRRPFVTARFIEVFSFVGTSTPTLVGLARTDGLTALSGWLDLISARLRRATDGATAGAMVVRERLVIDGPDFAPVCEVVLTGGSPRCTLPVGSSVELTGDLASDLAQTVGARAIYLASFDATSQRFWVCLTFTTTVTNELLQPLCDAMVAPVSYVLAEVAQHLTVAADDAPSIDSHEQQMRLPAGS